MSDINLGETVTDIVTNMEGIAVIRRETMYGFVEFAVQRRDRHSDPVFIAQNRLVVKDAGVSAIAVEPKRCVVHLGEKVSDKVTAFKGTAIVKETHMDGKIMFGVAPTFRIGADVYALQETMFEHERLKTVGVGFSGELS